ncbi:MAG: hypothetical protein KAT65_23600 [Methanophagales archaeon]|nr:hypothetical protein [Methanophagales archaeon]
MSNNNQIPWRIIIPAIVVILAAIIGATWAFWLNPPPSDFSISVNPMEGEVHQGGVIGTVITIKGIQGYEHQVSLGASGQPQGIVVSLVPTIGGPTPSYTSTVTINVDPIVPAGDYEIVKKGTGADGKEHRCIYTLTVKPSVTPMSVTPTPTLTPTPTPTSTEAYIVYSDNVIAAGDVLIWSGGDLGLEPPLLADGSYVASDAPEGTTCFAVKSGSGQGNYVGWGVFLGIFKDHKLVTPHTVDLSDYENLQFWVKTSVNLKVEIQQDNPEGKISSPCLISNYGWSSSLPDIWQKVTIPKSAIKNVDLTKIFCPFMITGTGSKITFYVDEVMWVPSKISSYKKKGR